MTVDPQLAAALGFPKSQYTAVERERRWLCAHVPHALIRQSLLVKDLYVANTRLRLRDMQPTDGGPAIQKLSRKADLDASTRLITTIYLQNEELSVLAIALQGDRLVKLRHRLHAPAGVLISVDEFQGPLAGLILAEAEFQTAEAMNAFPSPSFATREVTSELPYTGAWLARHGLPSS